MMPSGSATPSLRPPGNGDTRTAARYIRNHTDGSGWLGTRNASFTFDAAGGLVGCALVPSNDTLFENFEEALAALGATLDVDVSALSKGEEPRPPARRILAVTQICEEARV